jgi:restriction system protein
MGVPGHQTFMRPLLEILIDGQEHVVRDTYSVLADHFSLTDDDRREQIPSGTQRLLDNRVGWAKTYLLKAGLLESPRRGVIRITERGRAALATKEQIDNRYLRQFAEFVEFFRVVVRRTRIRPLRYHRVLKMRPLLRGPRTS